MKVTTDLLTAIMNRRPHDAGSDLEWLADELRNIDVIQERVRRCRVKESQEVERHQKVVDGIKSEIREIQSECHHYSTTFYPDPAGGSDSEVICNICNKEL